MDRTRERVPGDRLGHDDTEVRAAIRFAMAATAAGIGFLILALLWVSTCPGTTVDTVACGAPERTLLAVGCPLILLGAGLWAFVRTYRVYTDDGVWWGWHGAGWLLLTLMVVTLVGDVPPIIGPILGP
ncbi:MAG: hypothetical protein WCI78_10625 [Mycobacterium sp.]